MKQITKNVRQPDSFKAWKVAYRAKARKSATYKSLEKDPVMYTEVKNILIKEQYFLCCYCCNRVKINESHIEHFIPQEEDRSKQLDYHNMFISCNGYVEEISTIDRESCGHRKNNWYDRNLIVSPTDLECERIFEFLANGSIQSKGNDLKATAMISNLGLDCHALNKARESAIDTAFTIIGLFENNIDNKALQEEIEFNKNPNSEGELPPFCDAVLYVLEDLCR